MVSIAMNHMSLKLDGVIYGMKYPVGYVLDS